MPKISKKAIYKAQWDDRQFVIDPLASAGASERKKQVTTVAEYKIVTYYCPFCLYFGRESEFETKTSKGRPSKKMMCPDCKNYMLKRTLEEKMTSEQYAIWVWGYRVDGFWRKCNFKVWKERLYKLGMAHKFWTKYKELKGPTAVPEDETDEARFNREMHDAGY